MASNTHLLSLFLYLTMLTPSLQQQCPSACRCPSGTEVRCSNAGLTAIPPDIPTTVEKLFLDGNSISEVNSSHISALQHLKLLYLPRNRLTSVKNFANLPNLEILNLASNNISYVDGNAFENSTKLKYIFLSKNSLTTVPTGLEWLQNLQILTLDDNNIRTANAAFLVSLGSILRIDLHNNPWSCDCRLRGLKNWMSETQAEVSLRENVTCALPEHLIGRAIDDVRADDMVCATTATVDNETTKRKTKTTLTTTDVDVHGTRTTVYSSPSAKAVANTDRTTDTHSATLSTQHHTTTTGAEEDQYSRIMNATKPLMPFKSTSGNRVVSSGFGKGYDDKDDLKWIIPVAVLGAAVVVLLIFALKHLSKYISNYRRRPRHDIQRPVDHVNPQYIPDDAREEAAGRRPNVEDNVVTEQQLRALATKLGAEWEQLSTELGFSHGELFQFKTNNPHNVRQAMFVMLATWRRKRGREATIGRLLQHMRNVNIDEDTYGVLLN